MEELLKSQLEQAKKVIKLSDEMIELLNQTKDLDAKRIENLKEILRLQPYSVSRN